MGCRKGTKSRVQKELEAIATRRRLRLERRLAVRPVRDIHDKSRRNVDGIQLKFASLPCVKASNGVHIVYSYQNICSGVRYLCHLCKKHVNKTNKYKRSVLRNWTAAEEEARIRDAYNEIIIMAEADECRVPNYLKDSMDENYSGSSMSTTAGSAETEKEGNSGQ